MTRRADRTDDPLYAAFAGAARGITPSPVPLAAIERAGRARRRRRAVSLTVACALLAPLGVAVTLRAGHTGGPAPAGSGARPTAPVAAPPRPSPPPTPSRPAPRLVEPGEVLRPLPGVRFWLTQDGKHWSTPGMADQFRSAVDGNLPPGSPTVSLQSESVGDATFASGLYTADAPAASVELTTDNGPVAGVVVRFAAQHGWGAWYAVLPPGSGLAGRVTVYDAKGRRLARLGM